MNFFSRGGRWKSSKEDGSREDAFDTGGGGATDRHYLNCATTGYFQELIRVRISIVMFFCISMNLDRCCDTNYFYSWAFASR
jgi:hypothetical protein